MIPLNKLGRITNGEEKGFYIEVKREPKKDGAYYVFTSRNPDFSTEVFDDWFQTYQDLADGFLEDKIEVEWLGKGVISDLI